MGFVTFVQGRGMVDSDVLAVDRAVSEYDERLYFDRNPETGDYCIYMKMLPGEAPLPILGFEKVIPSPEAALRRLYAADSMRQGEEILNGMRRRNHDALEPLRRKADDASGQLAEGLEILYRKTGDHPSPRVFVPGDK